MKISEVEELLGISKSNIRFYEKQGLLKPGRSDNRYRVYDEEDLDRLKTIIILRKIGVSLQDIQLVLQGTYPLQDAMEKNIKDLEQQIEVLGSALKLSKQIADEGNESLDTSRYWQMIHEEEEKGGKFYLIMSEYWTSFVEPMIRERLHMPEGTGLKQLLLQGVIVYGIFALVKTFIWGEGNLLINFFYWPMLILFVALIYFPLFLLDKKNPKIAGIFANVVIIICSLVIGVPILYILFSVVGRLFGLLPLS